MNENQQANMDMDMDESTEIEFQRQWKMITIVDTRLKRVCVRQSMFYASKRAWTADEDYNSLVLFLNILEQIHKNVIKGAQIHNDLFWILCGPELRSSIVCSIQTVTDIRQCETDAIFDQYQAKIDRVKRDPQVRALEALEAESQTLKIDLDEIKQQNQAFKDTQEANVHRLYARLNVAKENLRQFMEEQNQIQQEHRIESQQNDDVIVDHSSGVAVAETSQSEAETSEVFQLIDIDGRPISPLTPIKIDEPPILHNVGNSNKIRKFFAWPPIKDISLANGAVGQVPMVPFSLNQNGFNEKFNKSESIEDIHVDDLQFGAPFNDRFTPKTYSSKWKNVKRQLNFDSSSDKILSDVGQTDLGISRSSEKQIDSNGIQNKDEFMRCSKDDDNDDDNHMKNGFNLSNALNAIQFPPKPDSSTTKLMPAVSSLPSTLFNVDLMPSTSAVSLQQTNDSMDVMEMGDKNGSAIEDAVGSSYENNNRLSTPDNDTVCDLFTDSNGISSTQPLQHLPLVDNDDYPVYDVANRRIIETIIIDDSD